MKVIEHLPKKVKFVMELSFPLINKLLPRKGFVGGRIGYPKEEVFRWLLVKKINNWDYRSVAELSNISLPEKALTGEFCLMWLEKLLPVMSPRKKKSKNKSVNNNSQPSQKKFNGLNH